MKMGWDVWPSTSKRLPSSFTWVAISKKNCWTAVLLVAIIRDMHEADDKIVDQVAQKAISGFNAKQLRDDRGLADGRKDWHANLRGAA